MKISGEQFHMRLTEAEKRMLALKAEERGISRTAYVKECVFGDKKNALLSKSAENIIYSITDILINRISRACDDAELIELSKNKAVELWRILNK